MPAPDVRSSAPAEEKPFQDGTSAPDVASAAVPAEPETSQPVANAPTDDAPAPIAGEERLIAGRYRIKRRIGGGAMGIVYLAHDDVLDRTVALKELLLSPALGKAETEYARKRSFREARLAARLQHPHAITVFNVVEDDGKPVLVMEYLASKSLAETLAERRSLPPEEVARIGAETASALASAHEAGIVHRDVKPGNILIGEDGIVKITDFGISRAADDGTLTGSGQFAGTPAFLSPEAARGEPPSQASDVFSLGATLYTAVEGHFPYGTTENQMALLYAAAAGRYTPPVQAGPLTGVLTRMMAFDARERPSMAEAAGELAGVAAPEPPSRRSRRLLFAGLALLVVVAAGVTVALVLEPVWNGHNAAPSSSPSATRTPTPTQAAGPTSEPSVQSSTAPSSPALTMTGTTVPPAPQPTSLVDAVQQYYQLLPNNLDAAWTKLGPDLQQRNGKAGYVAYWSRISDIVVIGQPQQIGTNTVEVTIQYNLNGERNQETHRLGMIVVNGQPLIDTDPPVGYERVG